MPTAPGLFISYRREDTRDAAHAVYTQFQMYFGSDQVFMDVNTIGAGNKWPERIRTALEDAKGVVVLIGHNWLFSHDAYGRRRLDLEQDWVRLEVRTALERDKRIYPVLLGATATMPVAEALPEDIASLASYQVAASLRHSYWVQDINGLARALEKDGVLKQPTDTERAFPYPNPNPTKAKLKALTEQELADALAALDGWEPWSETIVSEYPHQRQELRRTVLFDSFPAAIAFMQEAALVFQREDHHPRWANQWRTLTIRLATWDAGNKITTRDVEVAAKIDQLLRDFLSKRSK